MGSLHGFENERLMNHSEAECCVETAALHCDDWDDWDDLGGQEDWHDWHDWHEI